MTDDVILETRGLTKEFRGFYAVRNVELRVRRGRIHALIGPNGAGKTTCFNLLTHFLAPTAGRITGAGQAVLAQKPHELRLSIGYVIQQVGLFPHRTIGRNIATVPELLGWDKYRISARVEELMALVGLDVLMLNRSMVAVPFGLTMLNLTFTARSSFGRISHQHVITSEVPDGPRT